MRQVQTILQNENPRKIGTVFWEIGFLFTNLLPKEKKVNVIFLGNKYHFPSPANLPREGDI